MSEYTDLWDALAALLNRQGGSAKAKMLDGLWKFAEEDFHGVSDAANDLREQRAKNARANN